MTRTFVSVDRLESRRGQHANITLGPSLWLPQLAEESKLHSCSINHACTSDRREHCHLLGSQLRAAEAAAVSFAGTARGARTDRRGRSRDSLTILLPQLRRPARSDQSLRTHRCLLQQQRDIDG